MHSMAGDDTDDGLGTLLGTGMEESSEPLIEAISTIAILRDAIRRGDSDGVRLKLDLHAHGAGRRGLLSTLAGTANIETAVSTLSRFWQSAEYTTSAARVISPDETEVYETIAHPAHAQKLRTVTLLRRRGGHWRIVTTTDTPDEKLVASLLCPVEPLLLEDALPGARLDYDGDGKLVRLVNEDLGWQAALRLGPVVNRDSVDNLELGAALADTETLVSVAFLPSRVPKKRRAQLAWFANVVAELAEAVKAPQVFLPWCDRLLETDELHLRGDVTDETLAARYVHVLTDEEWIGTRGMSHFMLPELEARTMDWPSANSARAIVEQGVEMLVGGGDAWMPRTSQTIGDTKCWIEFGRRGRELGQTYGRWGSLRLAPART